MTYDDVYVINQSIRNLQILKMGYDACDNKADFINKLGSYTTVEDEWDVFFSVLGTLFSITEVWGEYEKEYLEEKEYWTKNANCRQEISDIEDKGMVLILDDIFRNKVKSTTSACGDSEFAEGYITITHFDRGVLIIWDSDYGHPDLVEALYLLIGCVEGTKI